MARIVRKAYSHMEGLDYDEAFGPVTGYDYSVLIIGLATHFGHNTDQLEINSGFLYGDLIEESCVTPSRSISLDGKILPVDNLPPCLKKSAFL